jgi:chemotaxis response regulator CheB
MCLMDCSRIVLVGMPTMLHDLVKEIIANEPDMQIVDELPEAEAGDEANVLLRVVRARADVLVIGGSAGELPEKGLRLLHAYPKLRVLGVSSDGRRGFIAHLRADGKAVGDFRPHDLVDAIRRHPDE